MHPSKEVVVTASDDHTWKMWALPRSGWECFHWLNLRSSCSVVNCWWLESVILTGCQMHPSIRRMLPTTNDQYWMYVWCRGDLLATTSGDGSVKLWDFSRACCSLTLSDHQQPGIHTTAQKYGGEQCKNPICTFHLTLYVHTFTNVKNKFCWR